jgi:hypothetical protein
VALLRFELQVVPLDAHGYIRIEFHTVIGPKAVEKACDNLASLRSLQVPRVLPQRCGKVHIRGEVEEPPDKSNAFEGDARLICQELAE